MMITASFELALRLLTNPSIFRRVLFLRLSVLVTDLFFVV